MLFSITTLFLACGDKEDTAVTEPSGEASTEPSGEASTGDLQEKQAQSLLESPQVKQVQSQLENLQEKQAQSLLESLQVKQVQNLLESPSGEASTEPAGEPSGEASTEPAGEPSNEPSYNAGDIVISEIMKNPCQEDPADSTLCLVDDEFGEWVELYNASSSDIDLQGFSLSDNGGTPDEFTVSSSLVVAWRICCFGCKFRYNSKWWCYSRLCL